MWTGVRSSARADPVGVSPPAEVDDILPLDVAELLEGLAEGEGRGTVRRTRAAGQKPDLIESLARPGGNVTGITDESVALSAKRLEILKEAVPRAVRMAVLWNADDRGMTLRYRQVEKAAQMLHVTVQALGVREPDNFDMAFSAMALNRPDALFLVTDALTILNRKRVIDFAEKHRIPAMFESGFLVRDGGLISYGRTRMTTFAE